MSGVRARLPAAAVVCGIAAPVFPVFVLLPSRGHGPAGQRSGEAATLALPPSRGRSGAGRARRLPPRVRVAGARPEGFERAGTTLIGRNYSAGAGMQ
jgi:hypothetical protein